MNRTLYFVLLILFPVFAFAQERGTDCPYAEYPDMELKVMSFNIRNGRADDGDNSWDFRKMAVAECINSVEADVIGLQEVHDFQLKDILDSCPEYSGIGIGRDDGHKGEQTSILWNGRTVELLNWGAFWLSETPAVPSIGWDAKYLRTATWALFRSKENGRIFLHLNTHLDNKGKNAQKEGLRLICRELDRINDRNCPVVITGDFNIPEEDNSLDEFKMLMTDARMNACFSDEVKSFNAWGDSSRSANIDYIFYSGFKYCSGFQTVVTSFGGKKLISDHFPVCATLLF